MPLLAVNDLRVTLNTSSGAVDALRGVSFDLDRGQTLGLIGESGCGKSITALALMGLLPDGATVSGSIRFGGQELTTLDEAALCELRGNRIGMVFQEPMTALNPLHTVGHQIAEPLRLHKQLPRSAARAEALRLLERVQLPQARARLDAYPHQLSGGQRQRVVIAIALACGPDLLIADEPTTALNPLHTVGHQIAEPLRLHKQLSRSAARAEALRLLERVQLPQARARLDAYPHQLSGGQRQRVVIAIALACGPDLLIADEPTTALDVTIQREVLDLIHELVREERDGGMALLLISHDLGVMADTVRRMLVMYGGTVVESGATATIFEHLAHPYTRGLFAARPRLGLARGTRLATIAGRVPSLADMPPGCPFADRCALVIDDCRQAPPPPVAVGPGHTARCIRLGVAA